MLIPSFIQDLWEYTTQYEEQMNQTMIGGVVTLTKGLY